MPALPPVPGVIKATLHFTVGDDLNAQSRLYFAYSSAQPNAGDMNSFATAVRQSWTSFMQSSTGSGCTLTSVVAQDLGSNTGNVGTDTTAVAGTTPGTSLPGSVCLLMNAHVARRYRGGKPRVYLPILVQADLGTGSQLTSALPANFTAAFTNFIGGIANHTFGALVVTNSVNVSFYSGFTTVTNPITGRARNVNKLRPSPLVDVISKWSANPRVASQRRRNLHSA